MKKSTLRGCLLAAVFSFCASNIVHAAETFVFDPTHTAITFHINHFGFSTPSGKFMNVEGSVKLDEKNPSASSVDVTIPIGKLETGVPKLDEHLMAKDFFDVATYPTATFKSEKVEVTSANSAKVTGNLTLHGITRPVTLDVKLNKIAENMMKKRTAGFTASTTLRRSEFGMSTYIPNLADEVRIDIESEANLAEEAPAAK